jgi:two-component system LytT family response regulator
VLLDIQFEREGRTGYDLLEELEKLKQLKFQIIIITGHTESEYYSRAYDFNVIHFLKKPLNKHKLSDAIDRVRNNLNSQRMSLLNELLNRDYQSFRSVSRNNKLNIEGTRYNEVVDIADIVWIEAEGRKTVVHIKGGKIFNSNTNIGHLEEQLLSHNRFIRIHRSEIINLDFVERYAVKERLIVLQDPVPNHFASKERFPEFIRKIGNEV